MSTTDNPHPVTISANGQQRAIGAGSSIADFLREIAIAPTRVVAQLDGVIIPRDQFELTILQEGSQLELVTLVGGG